MKGGGNRLQEKLGQEEYDRITAEGLDSPTDKGKYTAAEVKAEMRDGNFGGSVDERADHFRKLQESGTKFNGRAQEYLASKFGFDFGNKTKKPEEPDETPDTPPENTKPGQPVSPGTTAGGQSQGVNQDNDISTTINGNNNTVTNSQDNSVNQTITNNTTYGGSTRNFTYSGGKGEKGLYDSPVSKATMGGYYDVDDSPAASQQFLDRYIGANSKAQAAESKRYKAEGSFDYNAMADKSRAFNPVAMQERLDREPLIDYDRNTIQFADLFGDMANKQFDPGPYMMPKPPSKIESKAGEIAKDYKDDLDNLED